MVASSDAIGALNGGDANDFVADARAAVAHDAAVPLVVDESLKWVYG